MNDENPYRAPRLTVESFGRADPGAPRRIGCTIALLVAAVAMPAVALFWVWLFGGFPAGLEDLALALIASCGATVAGVGCYRGRSETVWSGAIILLSSLLVFLFKGH